MLKVKREGERWEEIAQQDPMWAILAYPERKYGRWGDEEFFRTGAERIDQFMTHGSTFDRPARREVALDFGCGVGRLTRALAAQFDNVVGVDISQTMVNTACELNADRSNCSFRCNTRADLSIFSDASVDFIGSDIVLQHLPDRTTVESYLAEFLRVLRPGGLLVFQLPASLSLALRMQPRRTAYRVMRRLGVPARTLYWRLGLHPNRMLAVRADRLIAFLGSRGADVLDVVTETSPGVAGLKQNIYYVTR